MEISMAAKQAEREQRAWTGAAPAKSGEPTPLVFEAGNRARFVRHYATIGFFLVLGGYLALMAVVFTVMATVEGFSWLAKWYGKI